MEEEEETQPLFNVVVNPGCDGQTVFGPYPAPEAIDKFSEIARFVLNNAHDPAEALDGMEIVACRE